MEKLTINELAPYLPYGLTYYPSETSDLFNDAYADNSPYTSWNYISALDVNDEYALKLKNSHLIQYEPFMAMEDGELFLGQFKSSLGFDVDDVYATEVKPILRPLSDLTKEINHNGKIIIPMLELYKIAKGVFQSEIKYHSIMATNQIQVEMVGYRNYFFGLFNSVGDLRLGLGYHFRMYSTDLLLSDNKGEEVQFQNILFKKLYEWHFDLHGLIEENLAIDVNTLTNKK